MYGGVCGGGGDREAPSHPISVVVVMAVDPGPTPSKSHLTSMPTFGDLDVGEIAKAFNISERLVRQEIVHSRAWLLSQMGS